MKQLRSEKLKIMSKTLLLKITVLLATSLLLSCSHSENIVAPIPTSTTKPTQLTYHGTTIKAVFTRGINKTNGNFNLVHYEVETNRNQVILNDALECYDKNTTIECSANTDLSQLKPGIYRLMVRYKNGLLGCDLFEISPGVIPVLITIDNESTGMYLSSMIMQKTSLTQKEIYQRVAVILGGKPDQVYDLEPTLYDLFMYYNGDTDSNAALTKLVNAIKNQQSLHLKRDTGISNTLKPLI